MKFYLKISPIILMACCLTASSCTQETAVAPAIKTMEDAVFASGHLEQENLYTVSAIVDGLILSLPVEEGDEVSRHQLIALVDNDVQNNQLADALVVYNDAKDRAAPGSPELESLSMQIEQARNQLTFDEENYLRYQSLYEKQSVSRMDFEQAELKYQTAQTNLSSLEENYAELLNSLHLNVERSLVQVNTQQSLLADYQLTTEEAGLVIDLFKSQGELVRKGEAVARIASGDYLIKLLVAEEDITKVELGQQVKVFLNTYPDRSFQAQVTKVYPSFDESEQSYLVEAKFNELPDRLFSGTQLQANIEIGLQREGLVVPSSYVGRNNTVVLASGEEREIEVGSTSNEWTEVLSGLSIHDQIVQP
ncbi:MAG: efflux RND transporter periplasmic adaptor subunit [Bacteroidota bacterium]